MKSIAIYLYLLVLLFFPGLAIAKDLGLERGLAITDPDILVRLEKKGLSLVALLSPGWTLRADSAIGNNKQLAAMPEMKHVFSGVGRAVEATRLANPSRGRNDVGVGMRFDRVRLFDQSFLSAPDARFALVGAVQRLDRAYKQAATCGEVRLLYRLEYERNTVLGLARSRLPMTFNLVFKAKDEASPLTCQDIARR